MHSARRDIQEEYLANIGVPEWILSDLASHWRNHLRFPGKSHGQPSFLEVVFPFPLKPHS
jgi:hypothetical protein